MKVKNGSPWPEAVLISFSLFVQEAEEEGVAGGTTNKLVCAPVVLETNLVSVFCFCAHLARIDKLICLVLS